MTKVSTLPSYFLVGKNMKGRWSINVVFEVKVNDLNFISSEECQEIRFVSPEEIKSMNAFRTVQELGTLFDSKKHQ